jgi:hypothetical protein
LLTFDASQAASEGANAGLAVNRLGKPLGEEPENRPTKKV